MGVEHNQQLSWKPPRPRCFQFPTPYSALLNNGMISKVLWNGHLAVELASCQFQYIFGRAGCPLYSYSFLDSATPPTPDSRLPTPDSRFPIPDSRFPIPDSRFPIPYQLPINNHVTSYYDYH